MDILAFRGRARSSGITLIELVSTLAITTVVLTGGVPEMQRMLAANRITTSVNTLVAHLHLARSEAVKQGKRAVLCPSDDGDICISQSQWHRGTILFVDENGNRERDENDDLVRYFSPGTKEILITSSANRRRIRYQPDGASPGTNLTITFCDRNLKAPPKAVIVSNTGRPRISRTRPDGSTLICT